MTVRLFPLFVFALCLVILSDVSLAGKRKKKSRSNDETGLAESLHDVQREMRRKLCLVGHMHFGSSDYHRKKKAAQKEAIVSWEEFTAFEYGWAWARFKSAGDRKVDCRLNDTGLWQCDAEGRACRKWRRSDKKKYAAKPKEKKKRRRWKKRKRKEKQ